MRVAKERVAPGIYKAGKGLYDLHISAGKDADGRYRQVTKRIHGTLQDARNARAKLIAEAANGRLSTDDLTLSDLHSRFMALRGPALAPRTVQLYDYLFAKVKPLLGSKSVRKLNAGDLDNAYASIIANGVTVNTAAKVANHIRALLDLAYKHEIVHRNVSDSAHKIKPVPYEVLPPSGADVVRLVEAAMDDHEQFGALIYLAATTGARKGELRGLRWKDLDLGRGSIRFEHQPDNAGNLRTLKSKRGRTVLIDDESVTMLRRHLETIAAIAEECGAAIGPNCFVFSELPGNTEPMRVWFVDWHFSRLRKQLGLTRTRIHDLRHFQATQLLNSGVAPQVVAARLGHSDATITMSVYAHTDAVQDRKAANLGALRP
jgi:integrase